MTHPPPSVADREAATELGKVLRAADYTTEAVERTLELDDGLERSLLDVPVYERLVPRGTAFGTLVELFLLGARVPASAAARALAPLSLERLVAAGVLTAADGAVEATVEIAPTEDFLLASDRRTADERPSDHVLGFTPPTRVLATLTVVEPVERALDIGTGSGYQALHAAGVADDVLGVDVNPRALRFAEFNAALNGVRNVRVREGSLFEPVSGERFGLIISNPPYVISPETAYVFRDSGLPGDSFCEALVRGLPAHLEEGGHAVALITWTHGAEEEPTAPVRGWVEESGCDALLFRYVSSEPLEYAAGWNQSLTSNRDAFAAALERWLAYYEQLGIERISWGGLVLRRRSSGPPSWFWAHDPSSSRIGSASEQLVRLFRAQDFLRAGGDGPALLAARLTLADGHRLEETGRLDIDPGGPLVLRQRTGLCFRVEVDRPTVSLLALLDGRRTLEQAIGELAAASSGVDRDALAAVAVPGVRRLLELGFLVVADRD